MPKKQLPKFIVGLGASAGGLEALEHFFDEAPTNVGVAYVVVMHLSRDFKSMLDELLARHTSMPVEAAVDGERLEGDTVYVIQPATTIEVLGNKFKVYSRPSTEGMGPVSTIDDFFKSVAEQWKERGSGVVLSGSGSDGAEGIIAIDKAGGFTAAQSPETAKFDSMPLAAISTRAVRAIDAPEQLGPIVVDGMRFPASKPYVAVLSDHDAALAKILKSVVGISNIDAAKYKHSMFERRVRKRMMHLQIGSLTAYANLVADDPVEAKTLADTLLIGVTQFFRDEEAFRIVKRQIVPELIQQAQANDKPIRIWIPGCATGQEAYTFALLFAEAFQDLPSRVEVQIFATDIKRDFLGVAGRGEFNEEQVGSIPSTLLSKFFTQVPETGMYVVDPEVRKMIVFAPHDVLTDPPFTRLNMISCRNMLIYFSIEAQQKILTGFSFGLVEKGILFLGASETVGAHREAFEFIDAKNRIFRRTQIKRLSPSYQAPVERALKESSRLGISRRAIKFREAALQPAYNALLLDYAPASLLLSADRELLHSFGDARKYLRPPEGVAHFDAADMVDKAIKSPMIAGLERCLRDKSSITFSRITLKSFPSEGMKVDIEVRPLFLDSESDPEHVLVIIDESAYVESVQEIESTTIVSGEGLADERLEKLENELNRTREALQSTIEEIETTNEELQSSNEELMSSNEELQSTNEELSSVNEELYSVNAEYHRQNDELTQLSSDFDLLLQSTEIGVIFLDQDLCITRFTALSRDIFNLTEADIGRPIATFRSPFEGVEPDALLKEALSSNEIVEVEVSDRHGVQWLARSVAHIDRKGGVLTIINIGRLREAEAETKRVAQMLEDMQKMTQVFFVELNFETEVVSQMLGVTEYIGVDADSVPNRLDTSFTHEDDEGIISVINGLSANAAEATAQARLWHGESQTYRYVQFNAKRIKDRVWHITGFDIHEYVMIEQDLKEREAVLAAVLKASPSLVSYVGTDQTYRYVNDAYAKQWSMSAKDIVGMQVKDVLLPEMYKDAEPKIKAALKGKRQTYMLDSQYPDGAEQKLSVVYEPVRDDKKKIMGFAVDAMDITSIYDDAGDLGEIEMLLGRSLERSNYSVFVFDAKKLTIEYANTSALRRLGFDTGTPIVEGTKISRLTPTWGDQAWLSWLKSYKRGQDMITPDVMVFETHSESAVADLVASVIENDGEQKVILQVFDNTDRAKVMEDLEARSEELATSNRDLEQFASVVAHDLRAPLRHITQFSSLVASEIPEQSAGAATEYLDIITSSATKMADMVDGLLSYARIGRTLPSFKSLTLGDCVNSAVDLLAADVKEAGAKIITKDEKAEFTGDHDLIVRLLQNLIGNAVKYRRDDGAPQVKVSASYDEKTVTIAVEDNGIGIEVEHADTIFKLFKRLHGESEYDGLGVGLATCQRIAEIHGGSISLDPEFSKGARFLLTLPVKTAD